MIKRHLQVAFDDDFARGEQVNTCTPPGLVTRCQLGQHRPQVVDVLEYLVGAHEVEMLVRERQFPIIGDTHDPIGGVRRAAPLGLGVSRLVAVSRSSAQEVVEPSFARAGYELSQSAPEVQRPASAPLAARSRS